MKLKSLLLGSAAAMIAVTGARAADAVIAEPEPMEYVKVCDMYGAGFYYIPGTETCLNFNGYVRVDYTHIETNNVSSNRWDYRARVNVDARNETDWGTLRSQIRFQGNGNGGGDAAVGIDRALISLAGFNLGYSDTYQTTVHGYGLPVEKYDGYYAYDQAIFFDYTYAANGFAGTVGVQDSLAGGRVGGATLNMDYYAGLRYSGSWGAVAATYLYEEDTQEGVYKLSAGVNAMEGLFIKGWFMGDENGGSNHISGNAEWQWGLGASYQVTDTFAFNGGYSGIEGGAAGGADFFTVGARWNPVPGLSIRPEASFFDNDVQNYAVRVYRTW